MRAFFRNELFDAQLQRTMSHSCYGGADIAECLTTARHIPEKDTARWFTAWSALAERICRDARHSQQRGDLNGARDGFLRASNYYRNACIFLFGEPPAARLLPTYQLHREAFRQAVILMGGDAQEIRIPYERTSLRGYLFRAEGDAPRPALILNGGYDSTAEECYFWNAVAALRRGYHCLVFDGPGQGSALIEDGLHFRPDWEAVIAPVVDWLAARPEVRADRIGIVGLSFGGYLALRAATGEPRLAACVADPGQYSLLDVFRARLPGIVARDLPEIRGPLGWALRTAMQRRLKDPVAGWALRRGLFTHGVGALDQYLRETARYSLEGCVEQIACPALVCFAERDDLAVTARRVFDSLRCEKDFAAFDAEHCEVGGRLSFHRQMFAWLDRHLLRSSR